MERRQQLKEVSWCCELVGKKSKLLVVDLVFKVRIQEIITHKRTGMEFTYLLD